MFLSGLFSRFYDTQRFLKRRRSLSSSRRSQLYEASMEQLEQKRLLTVEYYGVTHSNTTANNEDFVYQVGVTDAGTSQLHMRYNALQNEIQFSDNSSFLNTRMMGIIPSGFGDTHYGSTDSTLEDPTAGGFALATNISVTATWNDAYPRQEKVFRMLVYLFTPNPVPKFLLQMVTRSLLRSL